MVEIEGNSWEDIVSSGADPRQNPTCIVLHVNLWSRLGPSRGTWRTLEKNPHVPDFTFAIQQGEIFLSNAKHDVFARNLPVATRGVLGRENGYIDAIVYIHILPEISITYTHET